MEIVEISGNWKESKEIVGNRWKMLGIDEKWGNW